MMPRCTHPKFSHVFTANTSAKKRGVLTAIKDTVAFAMHKVIAGPLGRYLILICNINSTTYTVVNIYAPGFQKGQSGAKGLSPGLRRFQSLS